MSIRKEIYLTRMAIPVVIDYVQNTNLIPIEFIFCDYSIPSNASVFAYVKKISGLEVFAQGTISGNTAVINPSTQMMAEVGKNKMQVLITTGGNVAASFICELRVWENITEDSAVESQNEYSALESLITQANETISAVTQATQSANTAAGTANTAANSANSAASAANSIAESVEQKLNSGDFAATVSVGTVTTGEPGTNASVTNTGTENDAIFNFVIPRGNPGSISNVEQQQVTFSEALTRQNIASGDTFTVLFGKIQKFFSDTAPLLDDSGWINVPLASGFTAHSSFVPQYRKIGKQVEVSGVFKTPREIGGSTTEVTMGTLPTGYRPSKMVAEIQHAYNYHRYQMRVNTNGTITVSRAISSYVTGGYTDIPAESYIFVHAMFFTN